MFGAWKQIKRKLKRKRMVLTLGAIMAVVACAALARPDANGNRPVFAPFASTDTADRTERAAASLAADNAVYAVTRQLEYVCGKEQVDLGAMTGKEAARLQEKHPDWTSSVRDGSVTFVTHIDDLSPDCRANAFFGIDPAGNLTLYEGAPKERKAIRTFFQLNVDYLESSLPRDAVEQLYAGIRIHDYADYNSVLSTFSDYAVDDSQQVLKPE